MRLVIVGLVALAGVGLWAVRGKERVPSGFGPLELGQRTHCPVVTGRFDVGEAIVRWAVVDRALPTDSTRGPISAFSLSGNADQSLELVAWSDGTARDTVRLTRDRQYRCSEGRMVVDLPDVLPPEFRDPSIGADGRLTRANRLALAIGADGALTADFARISEHGVAVWCGDGCKYFPVPFSRISTHQWTRVYPVNEDGSIPAHAQSAREAHRNEQLSAQEQALENGKPVREGTTLRDLRARAIERERAVERR